MRAGLYRHYKGNIIQVLGVAQECDTGKKFVVAIAMKPHTTLPGELTTSRLRVRDWDNFHEFVTWPDGRHAQRFEFLREDDGEY